MTHDLDMTSFTMHWYVILHVQYMNIIRNLTPRPLILHTSGAFHETFELFTSIVTTTPNVGSWDIRYYKYSAIARFVFVNMSVVSVEHYELFIHIFVCLHVGTLDIIWKRQLSAPVRRAWWLLSWTAGATGLRPKRWSKDFPVDLLSTLLCIASGQLNNEELLPTGWWHRRVDRNGYLDHWLSTLVQYSCM